MRSHAKASSAGSFAHGGSRLGRIVRGAFATRGSSGDADGSGAPSRARILPFALALATIFLVFASSAAASGIHPHLPEPLSHTGLTNGCGGATDSHGDLYVADAGTVRIYDTAGAEITSFASTAACQFAVDSTGAVYVQTWAGEFGGVAGRIQKYVPTEYPPVSTSTYSPSGVIDPEQSGSVAVDPATDDVYVSHPLRNETQEMAPAGMTKEVTTFTLGNLPPACTSSTTGPVTYTTTGSALRARINTALEEACSGGANDDFLLAGSVSLLVIEFQGQFAHQNVPQLTCTPSAGSCPITTRVNGGIGQISQYHSDGTLVTAAIGSGLSGASYSGLGVYATNGRVYAFDGAHNQIAIFNPGATTPTSSFDGSTTPDGSISAGAKGEGLAVDQSNGHAYVYDAAHNVVDEFKSSGAYVTQLANSFADGEPSGVAVDNSGGANAGDVYVVSKNAIDAFGPMSYDDGLTLSVIKDGTGFGTVTSSPAGVNCGPTCDGEFEPGTEVTLTATAETGSIFKEWSACDSVEGPHGEICKVTLTANAAVTATFIQRILTVSKSGPGTATIASSPAGIACGATCSASFADGELVTLTPSAPTGSKLKTWTGCDQVEGEACKVTMSSNRSVSAYIAAEPTISADESSNVGATTATVKAKVNPNGELTSWHFEYVDDASFQATGFTNAKRSPASDFSAGAGTNDSTVSQALSGLESETTYHFRLVATNLASPVGGTKGTAATFTTYAPPDIFPSCPNDSLRTGASAKLPDCRAYEQASPVDKNGIDVLGRPNGMEASVNGDAVLYYSYNGQPGSSGPQGLPVYLASRGSDGWSSAGLLPPASYGGDASIVGWLPDFSSVFSGATDRVSGSHAFLFRQSADGTFSTLSEDGSPTKIVGSSADGSVVYFLSSNSADTAHPLTPGAVADKPNLYAWDRDTNTLALAGVLPDSTCLTPPCISAQGATVQGEYPVADHTVSESGDAYFTDPATKQLYLRKDPFGASPTTVHVSASHRALPFSPLGATFRTATPDGQHAFFTSPEELTEDANTGPTLYLPGIGSANKEDASGLNGGLVSLKDNLPTAMASDEGHLYWVEPATDSIGRSKLDGSSVQHEFISGADNPYDVAVDAGHIYWTNEANGAAGTGTIGSADLNGDGAATNVNQSFIADATDPKGIDVDAAHVYWNDASHHIARADLPGGGVNLEYAGITDANGDVAVDGESIYYSEGESTGIPGDRIYFIHRENLDGSGHGSVLANFDQPDGTRAPALAVDGSHLFWTNPAGDKVGRQALAGMDSPFSTAVDSHGDLFALNQFEGVSIFGPDGKPITVTHVPGAYSGVSGIEGSFSIAVDSQGNLYVVNNDAGKTVRKFKPSNPGAAPTPSTTYSLDTSIGAGGVIAEGNTYAVAVDPSTDNVYVAQGDHISEYQANGTLITNTIGTGVPGALYVGVDVYKGTHDVYAADAANRSASKVYVFSADSLAGAPAAMIDGSNAPGGSLAFAPTHASGYGSKIAVDQSNGHLFVADDAPHSVIDEFDAGGSYLSQFSYPTSSGVSDLSLDRSGEASDGALYITSSGPHTGQSLVDAFDAATHQRIDAFSHDGYDTDPAFIDATAPLGVAMGRGTDSAHLYWSMGTPLGGGSRGEDLYRYDADTEDLTDLTPDEADPLGADVRGVLGASTDGSYVYFAANADLDGEGGPAEVGDCSGTGLGNGPTGIKGKCSLYVSHAGTIKFIARLDISQSGGQSDAENWLPELGSAGRAARVSANGRALVFRSKRKLTGYDIQGPRCVGQDGINTGELIPGPCSEIYRYTTENGLSCISCDPNGASPTWSAGFARITPVLGAPDIHSTTQLRNVSADGKRVFFESGDKLVAADTNGDSSCPLVEVGSSGLIKFPACLDVYEWEAEGAGSCETSTQNGGCIYLISSGTSPEPSFFLDASADGDKAFFFTQDQLVPQDTDGLRDVYVASAGGGLAVQHAPPPPICQGDSCHGEASSAANTPGSATSAFQGPGNQPSSQRCPKGKRKVSRKGKVRCVKPRKHKNHKRNRAANANGRASR